MGIPLAMHALKLLLEQGFDCELRIAGSGPDERGLAALSLRLGLAGRVGFAGSVNDMAAPATLPLSDYPALGGDMRGAPEQVYDPDRDAMTAPRIIDPSLLAAAIRQPFEDPGLYAELSGAAIRVVVERFGFSEFVRRLDSCLSSPRAE
jgi:glycosyltransferase involved in cell wall biosynthesis